MEFFFLGVQQNQKFEIWPLNQMSFIISRGYAEVQVLKTSESDPLSFWNILICICPNSEKSKTEKDITHFHM